MKVLVICSFRDFRPDGINLFIKEQVNAICAMGVSCDYYLVHGKGFVGYFKELPRLRKVIHNYKPDIIHAHYGLCGLLANLATREIPVVTTYHGSDINKSKARKYSKLSILLSAWNIFVSRKTMEVVHCEKSQNCSLVPCGVDLIENQLMTRTDARKRLAWRMDEKKILFAGMYSDDVKGPDLAKQTIKILADEGVCAELIELKGYTRDEVNRLMCAVDCLLMTSKTEGSPQVIKEALACGCPIVSTDVGDVKERIEGVDGCYVVPNRNPKEMATTLAKAITFEEKTAGREKIIRDNLSNDHIAREILNIYQRIVSK